MRCILVTFSATKLGSTASHEPMAGDSGRAPGLLPSSLAGGRRALPTAIWCTPTAVNWSAPPTTPARASLTGDFRWAIETFVWESGSLSSCGVTRKIVTHTGRRRPTSSRRFLQFHVKPGARCKVGMAYGPHPEERPRPNENKWPLHCSPLPPFAVLDRAAASRRTKRAPA